MSDASPPEFLSFGGQVSGLTIASSVSPSFSISSDVRAISTLTADGRFSVVEDATREELIRVIEYAMRTMALKAKP